VFAQYLCLELIFSESAPWKRIKWIASYFMLLIALFFVASKAALITSLLIIFIVPFVTNISLKVKIGVFVVAIVAAFTLFHFNPRLKVFRDTFVSGLAINPNARFGHDLRILSWDASLDIISDHWLFGVGEGRKIDALMEVYNKKGYIVPAEEQFNSHNMYLDLLIGGGIFAFGIFITGLFFLLYCSMQNRNYALLLFVLIFAFNGLFENLLSRHAGILFFTVFVSLLYARPKQVAGLKVDL
jgi:O-antigen ligase